MQKIIVLLVLLSTSCSTEQSISYLQNGDIIFQISTSSQSKAIQLATHSQYTHVGIIYIVNNQYFVYEAVQIVKLTPLDRWIDRGERRHFIAKRLKDTRILTPTNLKKMKAVGEKYQGKNYDPYFSWDDKKMYCSELVWKIYKNSLNVEIGQLQKIVDFDLFHPLVKMKLKERYGKNVPLFEFAISPEQILNSPLLETVGVLNK
ncbi:MAG: peptidoglycan peptidase [Beggiatoa sp. IS2]|nr:MAG: peptidoglycan peptidase [Beggiatoa sp. IS2]